MQRNFSFNVNIGMKIHSLTITKILGKFVFSKTTRTNRQVLECVCDCGKICYIRKDAFLERRIKTCGCKQFECKILSDNQAHYNVLFGTCKRGATSRRLSFMLTMEDFKLLIHSACYYCGLYNQNTYTKILKSGIKIVIKYNGIDRINNNLGYTITNSVPCCYTCNSFKSNFSLEKFINKVKLIHSNLILVEPTTLIEFIEQPN